MPKFNRQMIPKINYALSRDFQSRQVYKICYGCEKGFCKHKGRERAAEIANKPGRFLCAKCVANPPSHVTCIEAHP